ncbi:MAG: nucleotidyltransferase family protein [Planctomycetes bacterium]|nr:nucleotidyltransferase family protein [Planctomycetota bacterium]
MKTAREDEQGRLAAWLRPDGPSPGESPSTEPDWIAFVEDARGSGLAGLVLEHAARCRITLPTSTCDRLRHLATAVAAANLHLQSELTEIVRWFNEADVPVMLLKGAALNLTVYPRPDLRPMSDLDLLVRPGDAERALSLLQGHGCRQGLELVRRDFFPEFYHEVELFTGSPRPARIDLHARPLRPLRVARIMPDDALWDDAQLVQVGDARAAIPRPEAMFIHLAAHAAYHGCARLLWLYDLKRVADAYRESLDWELVTRWAGRWRLSLSVLRALEGATEQFGPFAPSVVMDTLSEQPVSWQDRLVLAHAPRDAAAPISHVAVNLAFTPGLRFRLRYLLALLRAERPHLAEIYPYRHPGWPVMAHAWRLLRAIKRVAVGTVFAIVGFGGLRGRPSARQLSTCTTAR